METRSRGEMSNTSPAVRQLCTFDDTTRMPHPRSMGYPADGEKRTPLKKKKGCPLLALVTAPETTDDGGSRRRSGLPLWLPRVEHDSLCRLLRSGLLGSCLLFF